MNMVFKNRNISFEKIIKLKVIYKIKIKCKSKVNLFKNENAKICRIPMSFKESAYSETSRNGKFSDLC